MTTLKMNAIAQYLMLIISLTILLACKPNQDAPEVNNTFQSATFCSDYSLVGLEVSLTRTSGDNFAVSFDDYDGGLHSGTGTGVLNGQRMDITMVAQTEFGAANMSGSIDLSSDFSSFSGEFSVLDPNNTAIITSTIQGQSGNCSYSLSPADVSGVIGTPLITDHHVELNKIFKVSLYRSAAGHNFVDYSGESCVNLKHYYLTYPDAQVTNSTVFPSSLEYYAPADGTVINLTQARPDVDPDDYELDIRLTANPNVIVRIFHFTPDPGVVLGSQVSSGQRIGEAPPAHINGGDIAVYVMTNQGYRHISHFEIMDPALLPDYEARGVDNIDWRNDLYYDVNDAYVSGITCDNGTWGNLNHPNNNWQDDYFLLN